MSDSSKDPEAATPARPRRPRRRRWLLRLALLLVLIAAGTGGGLWYLMGHPLSAPDWLRARVEARIGQMATGLDVRFGDMRLVVQPDGLARLMLVDVDIRSDSGVQVATLSDVEAGFTPASLMRREIELRTARLSGAVLTMRRDEGGLLGLALGDVFASNTSAPDIPTLIAQVDAAMSDPRLAGLRRIEADALTIRYEDARAQRGWTADGGQLSLTREDGTLRLAGDVALLGRGDVAATLALNAESPIGETRVSFGMNLSGLDAQDIASQSPALAWLETLRAPISGALRGEVDGDGDLGALSATLQIGEGVLQPNTRTQPIPFRQARTYFSFDPAAQSLRFDEISVQSALGTAVTHGNAVLHGIEDGWPDGMTGQFRVTRFEADPEGFLDGPVQLDGAELDWKLDFRPFRLQLGRLRSTDPELPLRLSGTVSAESDGWRLALDGRITGDVDRDKVLGYWPEAVLDKPRKWVADNIHKGVVREGVFSLRLAPGEAARPYIDARFEDVTLTYARHLPDLTGAAGQLTIYDNRLGVTMEHGQVTPPEGGLLQASGTRYVIPDMRERPNIGQIELSVDGPLTAALSYLDSPKLEIMQKANKPVTLGEGQVAVTGRIVLPLKPGVQREEMQITARGRVTGFSSDEIVPGKTLSANALSLDLDDTRLVVSGSADLSGVPFRGSWTQSLAPDAGSRVEGEIALSDTALKAIGVGLPEGTVSGGGTGQVTIALEKGQPPRFTLDSTMAGLGLSLAPIGWRLPENGTGTLELSGTLGQPVDIEQLRLTANGLDARGSVTLNGDGSFARLDLPRLRVGNWLDSAAVLTSRGRNAAPAVALRGGTLDLRRAPFGGGGGGSGTGGGGPVSVALDRLQVTDTIYLAGFEGDFSSRGGLNGAFAAQVGGTAKVTGEITPQHGGSAVRVRSRDAGDVLAGAGIFRNVQDGTFDLTLVPVAGRAGEYDGALDIEGARLQDAPAITGLLDAVSVVGLIDELNGAGIFFSEVEARFRLTPTQVVLTRSSAVGPSMGISMDGYYNLANRSMDMQGVLSPIYILNGIGRLFARKGEGLIGFNFNLAGPVDSPRVSVNPLSVFTPGMFRDIFRRPPPDVTQ